jgi:hypothetical protein
MYYVRALFSVLKRNTQKKEKTKRRAYQCPPPFIMEYSPANRAYTACLYYCPTSSISAIFRPKTMHVHNTWISYVNKSVSVAGFSGFVCIINNTILRKHTAILVCPVQGKQCVHLKFSDNFAGDGENCERSPEVTAAALTSCDQTQRWPSIPEVTFGTPPFSKFRRFSTIGGCWWSFPVGIVSCEAGWAFRGLFVWAHDGRAAAVTSGDRSQFSPSPANRDYTVCLYYCPTSSISAIFRPKTMHVHNTWISYVNKSVSVAGFSGFVCIINNKILRKHTAILVCPVQAKQCVHLKFSDNFWAEILLVGQ